MTRVFLIASVSSLLLSGCFPSIGGAIIDPDTSWDSRFASAGMGGNGIDSVPATPWEPRTNALASMGGDIFVGGDFNSAGAVNANYIAKWDGSSWSALGSGTNGAVGALAVMGTDLYVGGGLTHDSQGNAGFTMAGGMSANYIAKWNGSTWAPLGSGTNNGVVALTVDGTNLYAGGQFTKAGGNTANHIARWDGSTWSPLGAGLDGPVLAIVVSGTNVYVGGDFTTAGGHSANRIAKWDGTNWYSLDSGIDRRVFALAVIGSTLYAGGEFHNAGGVATEFIAKWDGHAWSPVGSGASGDVSSLVAVGGDLYAGGDFTVVGGINASNVAHWNGANWTSLGSGVQYIPGMDFRVLALTTQGTDLFAGGLFRTAGGHPSMKFAIWHSVCGTGTVDIGEECDDGNAVPDDGCESTCMLSCGNGVTAAPEECDDGNSINGDGCDNNCTLTACGNGIVTAPEQCDDGNTVDGDGCESNCTPSCGNGITTAPEECDDGNGIDGDGCDNNCTFTACGNGIVTAPEECDDGNTVDGDGCESTCRPTTARCGDGIVTSGEACDDGNTIDGDGCSSTCNDTADPESVTDPELVAGETLTSDSESDGATPTDPVETSIAMSVGTASATIAEASVPGSAVPGYAFFGQLVHITFNCSGAPCPSASAPLTIDFRIDSSRVPAGEDETTFELLRDGVRVPACTGAPGVADPNPCVASRQRFSDGDIGATVLTSLASEWGFARATCSLVARTCDDPGKALFLITKTTGDPSATKLLWKWLGGTISGASEFGDPAAIGSNYALCVYDGAALVESHVVASGGDCDGSPCWKSLGSTGFLYKNRSGSGDGITKILVKSGVGNAKILVKGRGANVVVPASTPIFSQTSTLTVQLVTSAGNCWQAVLPSPAVTSTGAQFKDKIP